MRREGERGCENLREESQIISANERGEEERENGWTCGHGGHQKIGVTCD